MKFLFCCVLGEGAPDFAALYENRTIKPLQFPEPVSFTPYKTDPNTGYTDDDNNDDYDCGSGDGYDDEFIFFSFHPFILGQILLRAFFTTIDRRRTFEHFLLHKVPKEK